MNKTASNLIDKSVKQNKGNIVSDMGGEKVMLSVENGKYYNLGEIGGAIWDLIEEKISVYRLVEELTSTYEVNRADCEEQVVSFLNSLLTEGLIEVVE